MIVAAALALSAQAQTFSTQTLFPTSSSKDKDAASDEDAAWKKLHKEAFEAYQKGDYDKAKEVWTKAIWEAEHSTPAQIEPGVVNCLVGLAFMNDKQGNFAESERLYELAMRDLEGLAGRGSPKFADYMADLADLYQRHDRADQAEVTFRDMLKTREAKARETDNLKSSSDRIESYQKHAEGLERYAQFLRRVSRNDEAVATENRAAAIRTSVQLEAAKGDK
jgi:tetratricopeptide (TPR) repeat protein